MAKRPGLLGFKVSPSDAEGASWRVLEDMWSTAGSLGVFDAAWLSDHLANASQDRGGPALESFTTAAALSSRVTGMWIGIAVAANTFRHPALLAKEATVLDNVTGGQFVLGLGSGWHEGEHDQFGIPLPALPDRYDMFEGSLRVLTALFSEEAREEPGVTLDDPLFPLRGATNLPAPLHEAGPPIWLGGQKKRGIALAVRYADGWPMPGNRPGDVAYFREKHDAIARALEDAGRDVSEFGFAAQLRSGETLAEWRKTLATCREFVAAGANHLIINIPSALGSAGIQDVAAEVAAPLRDEYL